jgi:putative acyl-CoA dehydrogenase
MNDLFLVLAQAPGGLSCFLVPRVLPDGTRNAFRIQRLKDKLGNRSNASSEPEFDDTVGWLVGPEGRGVRTIIEMVTMTRLDCGLGSAAGMRAALIQAAHHVRHRSAFGSLLIDKPLMRGVLADLALESEAATVLMMRVAGAVDRGETEFQRLGTALAKYWICKRQPGMVAEALECLGGNGYVEESGMPRLYRDAPLNGIWEGSGNVTALDVLRALRTMPSTMDAYLAEVAPALGASPVLDGAVAEVGKMLASEPGEAEARMLAERMALTLQAALLVRHSPSEVADAFCAARLGPAVGLAYGALPPGLAIDAILARIPAVAY